MYTQCPHCQAYFEVSADQLKVGDGDVRCGQCLSVFHALSYLSESLPSADDADPFEDAPKPAAVHQEPELGDIDSIADDAALWTEVDDKEPPAATPAEPQQNRAENAIPAADDFHDDVRDNVHDDIHDHGRDEFSATDGQFVDTHSRHDDDRARAEHPTEAEAPSAEPDTDAAEKNHAEEPASPPEAARDIDAEPIIDDEPQRATNDDAGNAVPPQEPVSHLPAPLLRQLQDEKAASLRPPATPWVIGSLLMLLVFLAQASYFYRDELAQRQPELRPWLEKACRYLDCEVRRPVTQAKIDILGWDVRSLPDTPQALLASTTLVNKSPTPQPYPLLTLRFSDINGAPLAQRRFLPREYLSASTDLKAGMPPDTPVLVELALVDPGKQAVNFEFHTEPAKLAR